jgi:hypothetical protein
MPIPSRNKNEDKSKFLSRCMSDSVMNKEYPDQGQRYAVCLSKSKGSIIEEVIDNILNEDYDLGYTESIDSSNIVIPVEENYVDFGEDTEEYVFSAYEYKDPKTGESYFFDTKMNRIKNGRSLIYVGRASEYQGKKVTLNKPFRTPDGPKKFSVYVKNDKGNVVKVNFGDPNMKIKKNIPERRKSFRARHNCDNPGPKWKARYWSCKAW